MRKDDYDYLDISNVASSSECTGLIPTPPEGEEEYRSYQELSGMEIPKTQPKANNGSLCPGRQEQIRRAGGAKPELPGAKSGHNT